MKVTIGKVFFTAVVCGFIWFYMMMFTSYMQHPVFVFHYPETNRSIQMTLMDTDSWTVRYKHQPESISIYPSTPHTPNSELSITWNLTKPLIKDNEIYLIDGVVFKSEELTFCRLDIYLNDNGEVIEKRIDPDMSCH